MSPLNVKDIVLQFSLHQAYWIREYLQSLMHMVKPFLWHISKLDNALVSAFSQLLMVLSKCNASQPT